jgi:bacteriorhodopsin
MSDTTFGEYKGTQDTLSDASSVPGRSLVSVHPPSEPTSALAGKTEAEKVEKIINPLQYYVKVSYMITYILLLTTATITFVEAITTSNAVVRHIMNLETVISIIAGYFYSLFLGEINRANEEGIQIDWKEMTKTRYVDWSITTPFMLLVLCAVLGKNVGKTVDIKTFGMIVLLNYFMLGTGYLGEIELMNKYLAALFGFGGLYGIFYLIYKMFLENMNVLANNVLFGIYISIWSLYGVVYFFDEEYKNIFTNILDAIAKSGMGIGLWAYYTKIISL